MKEKRYTYTAHYRASPHNIRKAISIITSGGVKKANATAIAMAENYMFEDETLDELMELHRFDKRGSYFVPNEEVGGRNLAFEVKL